MSIDRRHDRQRCPLALAGGAARRAVLALPLPLLLFLVAAGGAPAQAQTSATLSIASEYSLRGLSLSRGRPVPQLRIDHDTEDGWYWGAFGSRAVLRASPATAVAIAYFGRAHRLASGLNVDAGLSRTVFVRDARYSYTEVYAGVSSDRAAARLSLAPDYYGGGRSAYVELNGTLPLGARLRLSAHAGLLHRFRYEGRAARGRLDLRASIGADIGDGSVEFGLQARQRDPGPGAPRARALFASASISF
jgi:uncharacterized protein (TIGR02001 family)